MSDNKYESKIEETDPIEQDTVKPISIDNLETFSSSDGKNRVTENPVGDARADVLTSPFLVLENVNEEINPVTGELDYLVTDLHFPGKNGMDLLIQRKYSSYSSSDVSLIPNRQYNVEMHYWIAKDNKIQQDENNSRTISVSRGLYMWQHDCIREGNAWLEHYNYVRLYNVYSKAKHVDCYYTSTSPNTFYYDMFGLGTGWKFNFPCIETVKTYGKGGSATTKDILHMDDGRTFEINLDADSYASHLGVHSMDTYLERVDGAYVVKTKTGRKIQFNQSKQLEYIADKFGNKICFYYIGKRLTHIVDTYNRQFNLIASGDTVKWVRNETGETEHSYLVANNLLTSSTDKLGRTTGYEYVVQQAASQLYPPQTGDFAMPQIFSNLSKINYYNKLTTEFGYRSLETYPGGTKEPHRMTVSRKYAVGTRKDIFGGREYNRSAYEYEVFLLGQYEPWPSIGDYGGYVKTTTHFTDALKTIMTFNKDGLCIQIDEYTGASLLKTTTTEYSKDVETEKLPIKNNSTVYDISSGAVVNTDVVNTYYEDYKGNLQKKETSISGGSLLGYSYNQMEEFTYDSRYNMMTSKTCIKDNATKILEKYILNADGNLEVKKEVYAVISGVNRLDFQEDYVYTGNNLTQIISTNVDTGKKLINDLEYNAYTYEPTKTISYTETGKNKKVQDVVYDWYGRQTFTNQPENIIYQLDNVGRVTSEIYANNPSGIHVYAMRKEYKYNDAEIKVTITDEKGRSVTNQYDPFGNILNITDDSVALKTIDYQYDSLQNLRTARMFLPNGSVKCTVSYNYDYYNRPTLETVVGVGGVSRAVHTAYTDAHHDFFSIERTTVEGDSSLPTAETTIYKDHFGNPLQKVFSINGVTYSSVYDYDRLGNEVGFSNAIDARYIAPPYPFPRGEIKLTPTSNIHPRGRYTTYKTTNAIGQVTEIRYCGNDTGEYFKYHPTGEVSEKIDRKGNKTIYDFDAMGNAVYERNPVGAEKWNEYNNNGNLLKVVYPKNSLNGANLYTEYKYDERGRILEEKRNGSALPSVKYRYDKTGKPLEMSVLHEGTRYVTTKNEYDIRGNLIATITPTGGRKTFLYDEINRVTSSTDLNGNTTTFAYDGLDEVLVATVREGFGKSLTSITGYNRAGKISSIENETLKTSFIYDTVGSLVQASDSDGNTKYYEYNEIGLRTKFRLQALGAEQLNLTYSYNDMHLLEKVYNNGVLLTEYSYDANGNPTLVKHANGATTAYMYDSCNRIDTLVSKNNHTVLESLKHFYYPDSSMQSIQKQKDGVYQPHKNYTYDMLGRLAEECNHDDDKKKRTTYTYDHAGNRLNANVYYDNLGAQVFEQTSYTYNDLFQLLREESVFSKGHPDERVKDSTEKRVYQYDLNGNQTGIECEIFQRGRGVTPTAKPRVTFGRYSEEDGRDIEVLEIRQYNERNQLVSVFKDGRTMLYSYKPDGMRYSKTVDNVKTIHVWDGENIILDISDNSRVKGRYLRGSALCAKTVDNQTHFYLNNAHGDVVYITDQNANLLKYYDYSAFGIENRAEKNDANPFRYCGEYYDGEIRNIYLRARYYSPRTGRFTSEDPARDGMNWYGYCYNDPINLADTNGLWPTWSQVAGAVICAAAGVVTAVAVAAAAPAVAAGAAATVGALAISAGISAATAGTIAATTATVATFAVNTVAAAGAAFAAANVEELLLDQNFLKRVIFQGNEEEYFAWENLVDILQGDIISAGEYYEPHVDKKNEKLTLNPKAIKIVANGQDDKAPMPNSAGKGYTIQADRMDSVVGKPYIQQTFLPRKNAFPSANSYYFSSSKYGRNSNFRSQRNTFVHQRNRK